MKTWFFALALVLIVAPCCLAVTIADLSGHGHNGITATGFAGATAPTFNGSYATFALPTDTLLLSGDVSLGNHATYEARVRFSPTSYLSGSETEGGIWDSWQIFEQDTRLSILDGGHLLAYTYGIESPTKELSGGSLQTGVWYNLAYVYDGSQERLYIDGTLVASHAASGNIPLGPSNIMTLGAMFRDGAVAPAMRGDLASVRVSDGALYSGSSYVPIAGDFSSDASTQLLFNFDQVPEPSTLLVLGVGGCVVMLSRWRRRKIGVA